MQTQIIAENQGKMQALGKRIGEKLQGGEKIALIGNLGAGKTTLAKAILEGAGVVKKGFSPTFILDAAYTVTGKSLSEIHHFDLYRLQDRQELLSLGLFDLINQEDTAILVEWADKFEFLPEDDRLEISIEISGTGRLLWFKPYGSRYNHIIEAVGLS